MFLSGMSTKLIFLHSETFDLSRIKVSDNDQGHASSELAKGMESYVGPKVAEASEMNESSGPVGVGSDLEAQPADTSIYTLTQQVEVDDLGSRDTDSQGHIKAVSDVQELNSSRDEPLGELTEMQIQRGSVAVAEVVNCSTDPVSVDICNMTADLAVQPAPFDKTNDASACLKMNAAMSPDKKLDVQTVEGDSTVDINNGKVAESIEFVQNDLGIEEHVQSDCFKLAEDLEASFASEYNILALENGIQTLEEAENNKLGRVNEGVVLPVDLGCDEKDPFMCGGETKIDCPDSVELHLDVNNDSLNGKVINRDYQEADPSSIKDGEIPALDYPGIEDRSVSCGPYHV